MSKKKTHILVASLACLGVCAVGAGCGGCSEEEEQQPTSQYTGDMLYNGFDSVADLYRVDQLYTWGFQPTGAKLEIVGKDNFLPKDESVEEDTEEKTNYQAVIELIDALPELADVTFAHKDAVSKARRAYGCLTDENRVKVTNLSKLEALENSETLKGYYTVGNFGGDFVNDFEIKNTWEGFNGQLVDAKSGTIIFKASNLAAKDGSFYISLFHDDSVNKGVSSDGIVMMLRPGNGGGSVYFENAPDVDPDAEKPVKPQINFNEGQTISSDETYTFEITYNVAEDYSKLTLSIKIVDSKGQEIVNGSQDITGFSAKNFGDQTVKAWLTEHKNKDFHNTFYINSGYSLGAKIINAWTPSLPEDYGLAQDKDPHKNEDLAPRQGDGALRVSYETGALTDILAKFDDSLLQGLPVTEIGSFSIKVYNDSAEEKQVTLSLMQKENVTLKVDGGEFTLAPYAWTDCKVTLVPVVAEYFQEELIGLSIRFADMNESVYYLDDFRIQFGPVYTEETHAWIAKVDDLEKQIATLAGKNITVADKEQLETLSLKYNELPQSYRYTVENADVLTKAVTDYMSAVATQQIEAEGKEAVLYFDSAISAMQVGECNGAFAQYTADEAAPGTSGSMSISFDGSTKWARVGLTPSKKTGYEEIHVWVNNKSDNKRAFYLDWQLADQAFDAEGNEITLLGGYTLPANSGWIKLVYRSKFPLTQINAGSLSEGNSVIESIDTLLVGKIEFVYKFNDVDALISALPEYHAGYTDADVAAVRAAREAYDQLSVESQLKVTKLSKLIGLEGNIWKSGFSAISASSPDGLTVYNEQDKMAIAALRTAYEALNIEVKMAFSEDEALLSAFETKIEELQVAYVESVKAQISALDGTDKAAVAAARAAYDSLTDANKAKVDNASVLFGYEAAIWSELLVDLPAKEAIVEYDAELLAKLSEIRAEYTSLPAEVKALVSADEAKLTALEERLARFGEVVLKPGEIKASAEAWHTVNIAPSKNSGYDEARVLLRNDSENKLVFQATWKIAAKAYDEDGNEIALDGGYVLPANSGWITLVFTEDFAWSELNLLLFDEANAPMAGNINLTVESITFLYKAPVVEAMIDALDGTDKAAVAEARAAYEALSTESQAKVSNFDKLLGHEADLWKQEAMADLPTSVEQITEYDEELYGKVDAALNSYAALDADIQAKLTTEKALLDGLKEKIISFQDAIVDALKAQIAALDGTDKAAVAAARAAYDSLTEANKAKVDNASVLFGYEADIWTATLNGLPTVEEITDYGIVLAAKLRAARAEYNALADEVKALLEQEAATLTALEAKLAEFGEIVLKPGDIVETGSANGWYTVAIAPSKTTGYDEAHVVLRNNGTSAIVFQVNWNVAVKAYDAAGNEIAADRNGVIAADSGWITLAFTKTDIAWTELNIAHYDNGAVAGDIDLTVESITFINWAPEQPPVEQPSSEVVATPGNLTGSGKEWYTFAPGLSKTTGYQEAHVKLRNNGTGAIAFQVDWNVAVKAYDETGKEIAADRNGVIAANSGWITLVFTKTDIPWTEFNVNDNSNVGSIDVTVESVTFIYDTSAVEPPIVEPPVEEEPDETVKGEVVLEPGDIVETVSAGGWYTLAIAPTRTSDYMEAHVKLRNNGTGAIAFQVDWNVAVKAYDAAGNEIAADQNGVIAADSGWITLVFTKTDIPWTQFNINDYGKVGSINLTVESVTFIDQPTSEVVLEPGDIVGTGSANGWYTEAIAPSKTSGYLEAHVKLRNNGTGAIAFQVNWNVAVKAYDETGKEIVADKNGVIAADSGWITLVFTKADIPWTEFNINDNSNVGSIDVTVESITFVYKKEPVKAHDFSGDISQVSSVTVGSATTTNVTAAYSEKEQALELGFSGLATGTWVNLALTPGTSPEFATAHLFIKNDTNADIVVQMNWNKYTSVASGDASKITTTWDATCIKANSGWVEIVYTVGAADINNLNIALVNEVTSGALYISQITVE